MEGEGKESSSERRVKIHRFSVCDSNIWIGVNPRVVVAPFARRHLWCICAAISVGSQCVVARFARRHLRGICGAVSVGNTEDQRRVLKEKTSPRMIAPSNLAGRIPLAKYRGRHYFGTHLSTKIADFVWACMSKSRNTEDQRRVLKEKTSPRLIVPSNFEGRIPLAKDRGRHYCIGTHLSTKMADSVESRVEPAAGKR